MVWFKLRGLVMILVIILFVWSSSFDICNASKKEVKKKKKKSSSAPPYYYTSPPPPHTTTIASHSSIFNVLDFGAKGYARTDDTKAFIATWEAACKVEASTITVPTGFVFLIGPVTFSGPCQPNIIFQLNGKIIAPSSFAPWGKGLLQWINFKALVKFTIKGNGLIDGQGQGWWGQGLNEDYGGKVPSIKPTALRFYGSNGVTVTGITLQHSAKAHLKFDNCNGVDVSYINIASPGYSPNTDGIHLQNTRNVNIYRCNLACGDDCISIQTGCSDILIQNINCALGHGISIGALGNDNTKACVSNIIVQDINMINTMTGVRIKTWQGGSGLIQGVMFSNIQVAAVQVPIMIDQFYCLSSKCRNQTSAVAISGVSYSNIRGTYTTKPLHFACSDSLPCTGLSLSNIQLEPLQQKNNLMNALCWKAYGVCRTPTSPQLNCLSSGRPTISAQSYINYC